MLTLLDTVAGPAGASICSWFQHGQWHTTTFAIGSQHTHVKVSINIGT
jgi:hypothetical protein